MIYNELYNFCKVRDEDRKKYSNRAKFLDDLLTRLGIEHTIVRTRNKLHRKYFYNIYCFGSSDKFLSAHYDIIDLNSDNANDNSASVINCIAYKLKNPSINLLILDGEEPPFFGRGSTYASKYLKKNKIPVKWILNLELTGAGSTFFIDNIPTPLSTCIQKNFPDAFVTGTPFNDAGIFRNHGLESNVITTVNSKEEQIGPVMTVDGMSQYKWEDKIKEYLSEYEDEDYWHEFRKGEDYWYILDQGWDKKESARRIADKILFTLQIIDEVPEEKESPKIGQLPEETKLVPDMAPLYISHTVEDSVDKMSIDDMRNFVDNVVDIIVKKC